MVPVRSNRNNKNVKKNADNADNKIKEDNIELILGSILDINHLTMIIKKHKPNIIYHAAAYKHVPLVESNPIEGIRNNIIGTKNLVQISCENKIEKWSRKRRFLRSFVTWRTVKVMFFFLCVYFN